MPKIRRCVTLLILICTASIVHPQQLSWYKSFSATIDKYPVTLHLHKSGPAVSGFYYYDKNQQPITISGDDTTGNDNRIHLVAYLSYNTDNMETFTFSLAGDSITGTWKASEKAKPLPVRGKLRKDAAVSFTMVYTQGSEKLKPAMEGSPTWSYFATSVWPTGTTETDKFLRQTIGGYFGDKTGKQPIGAVLIDRKKESLAQYREDFRAIPDSEITQFPSGFTQSEDRSIQIVYHSPRYLTLADFSYAFTGGAHGNYGTGYTVWDLTQKKMVMLDDVVTPAGKKQINVLLARNFRKQFKLKSTDPLTEGGLFEDSIAYNDNFYITGKGIGFNYVPYEIGPYAMGEFSVFISFEELKGFVKGGWSWESGVGSRESIVGSQ